jgi:hypothetical protein
VKPRGDRQPPLAVEIQLCNAPKHASPLVRGEAPTLTCEDDPLSHFSPLLPTILERAGNGQGSLGDFLFTGQRLMRLN